MSGHATRTAVWQTAATGYPDRSRGDLGVSNKTEPFSANYARSSIHVVLTGTPTGTPRVYASNDWNPDDRTDKWNGTWEDCSSRLTPAMAAPAGAGTSYLIGLDGLPFKAFYFDYTRSAGAGDARAKWGSELP
jgi:hypothetical protein